MHVPLGGGRGQRVDLLFHTQHVQRGHTQDLGLATLEQRRTVHPRQHLDLGAQRTDVAQPAAVDADLVAQHPLPHDRLGHRPQRGGQFLLPFLELRVALEQLVEDLVLDLVQPLLALLFARDTQRLGQPVRAHLLHGRQRIGLVLGEGGVFGHDTAFGDLGLRLAQLAQERFGGLQALGHDLLGGPLGTGGDQRPGVVGGLGLDHHDRDVAVLGDPAGHHHVENGPFQFAIAGERHPLPVDERHPHPGHRAGEW